MTPEELRKLANAYSLMGLDDPVTPLRQAADEIERLHRRVSDTAEAFVAREARLREALKWLLPLLDPMDMTPDERGVYEKTRAALAKETP